MNTKQFADALDENLFSDKIFKRIYLFYAFWVVLAPIITLPAFLFKLKIRFWAQHMFIALFFILTKAIEIAFNLKSLKKKKINIVTLLLIVLFLWFVFVSFLNNAINMHFVFGLTLFALLALFCSIDKRYFRVISIIFIAVMVCETCLGLIDLNNCYIPGFDPGAFAMSMHFVNPNWSGFVVSIAEIACLWFIYDSKKNWQKTLFFVGYLIMTVGLFVGGSYAPEASLFLCALALVIYLWIKHKKCPWWILSAFLSTIFISFAVWFIPKVRIVSTASANFFYESLCVIDLNLNTNLVESFSTFFNKLFGWNKMSIVAGADGWTRGDLNAKAWAAILENFKSFMIGYGAQYISVIRVHNCYLVLWLEFGLPALLLFVAICVMLLVRFIKVKKTDLIVFLFASFCMMLFEFCFCCIEPYCFQFFVILAAFLYRSLYTAELKHPKDTVDVADKIETKEVEINNEQDISIESQEGMHNVTAAKEIE